MEILNKYSVQAIGLLVLVLVAALVLLLLHLAISCSPYRHGYTSPPFTNYIDVDDQETVVEKMCIYKIPVVQTTLGHEGEPSRVNTVIVHTMVASTRSLASSYSPLPQHNSREFTAADDDVKTSRSSTCQSQGLSPHSDLESRKRKRASDDDVLVNNQQYVVAMARPRRHRDSESSSSSSSDPEQDGRESQRAYPMWSWQRKPPQRSEAEMHAYLNQFSSVHIQHNLKDPIPKDPEQYPGVARARTRRQLAESLSQYGSSQFPAQRPTNRTTVRPPPPKPQKFRGRNPHAYPVSETEIEIKAEEMAEEKSSTGQDESNQTNTLPRRGNAFVTGFHNAEETKLEKSVLHDSDTSLEISCVCLEHKHNDPCPGDNRHQKDNKSTPRPVVINSAQISSPLTSLFMAKKSSDLLNQSIRCHEGDQLAESYSPAFWTRLPQNKVKEEFDALLLEQEAGIRKARGEKWLKPGPQEDVQPYGLALEEDEDEEEQEWRIIIKHNPKQYTSPR